MDNRDEIQRAIVLLKSLPLDYWTPISPDPVVETIALLEAILQEKREQRVAELLGGPHPKSTSGEPLP